MDDLEQAIVNGAQQGAQALQQYISEWANGAMNEIGNQAQNIAERVQTSAQQALQAGGELYQAITAEASPNIDGTLTTRDPTTLGELFPDSSEFAMDNAQRGTSSGRPDAGGDQATTAARTSNAASSASGGNQVSKETPITLASPTYGLQETHTTILPYTTWFTGTYMGKTTPLQLQVRANSIWDIIPITIGTNPGSGTPYTALGFYGSMMNDSMNQAATGYPETLSVGPLTTERPAWRDYWATMYQYYTVLGMEYEIILRSPSKESSSAVLIAEQWDSYTDAESATGNIMPKTTITETKSFKNIKWHRVSNIKNGDEKGCTIIRGAYKPGMIKRNIINDGDVKTWTKTSTATAPNIPVLKEFLTLTMWKDPFDHTSNYAGVNIEVNLKYLVQFKDLLRQGRAVS